MPLLTGAVQSPEFDIRVVPRPQTPNIWTDPKLDGGETSFSRYALACAAGDDTLIGLPAFVMRAFRHRCFLVRRDSPFSSPHDLSGCRIGLTGWPDSGNTWTRALLRRAGIGIDQVTWFLGRVEGNDLPKKHDVSAMPDNVEVAGGGASLLEMLEQKSVDAVMSPFMPRTVRAQDSTFRFLIEDFEAAESRYYAEVGFVPGIHLVTLKREVVDRYPSLPGALVDVLDESKRSWHVERRHYGDTTPFLLAEIMRAETRFGTDWMPYGVEQNMPMATSFCQELREQGIASTDIDPASLFADYRRLTH